VLAAGALEGGSPGGSLLQSLPATALGSGGRSAQTRSAPTLPLPPRSAPSTPAPPRTGTGIAGAAAYRSMVGLRPPGSMTTRKKMGPRGYGGVFVQDAPGWNVDVGNAPLKPNCSVRCREICGHQSILSTRSTLTFPMRRTNTQTMGRPVP